ncbi:MAG: ketol-acid reductoisomerase [Candidatus Bathyarchaeota archaeon]|nr:ketol-acid reductoisomerase [Candidatus Bathyarchaeota archaeon]
MKVYYNSDVKTNYLKNKTIAVIGYGSQGKAQALNLRDSGLNVILGLRKEGKSWMMAEKDNFKVYSVTEASKMADIVLMLIPDMAQPNVYEKEVKQGLSEGKALGFAHGFNVHFGLIKPPKNVDVFMVAPKAPGIKLRETYLEGFGTPALVAVHQDYTGKCEALALEIAKALGCTKAGVIKTTFKDETESDIIGEQCVLVGGIMELIKKGFEVLVEEGYPPELAYFEACNELKLIVDLIYHGGLINMLLNVSETARYGGLLMGSKVIDEHVKENMKNVAKKVKSGEFAQTWIKEYKQGCPNLNKMLNEVKNHLLEKTGKTVRKMSGLEK